MLCGYGATAALWEVRVRRREGGERKELLRVLALPTTEHAKTMGCREKEAPAINHKGRKEWKEERVVYDLQKKLSASRA